MSTHLILHNSDFLKKKPVFKVLAVPITSLCQSYYAKDWLLVETRGPGFLVLCLTIGQIIHVSFMRNRYLAVSGLDIRSSK